MPHFNNREYDAFRSLKYSFSALHYDYDFVTFGRENKMSRVNNHRNKVLGSVKSLSARLKIVFCLLLTCGGLLLGGAGITKTVSAQCNSFNCPPGQNCYTTSPADCQDWCVGSYKCLIRLGNCSRSTPENPIHCATRSCVNPDTCPNPGP